MNPICGSGVTDHTPLMLSTWQRLVLGLELTTRRARGGWRIYRRNRLAMGGLGLLILYALMALSHPVLLSTAWRTGVYDPETGYDSEWTGGNPSPPSPRHLLGTDGWGRDVLSRLMYSARPTFALAAVTALATAWTSVLVGAMAAYYRRWVDAVIASVADALLLLPAPIFMVILGVWMGDQLGPVGLGLGYGFIFGAGAAAIVMRAHALTIVGRTYIEAARAAGAGGFFIISRHLVPQMLPLATVQMTMAVTGAIIADGFISYFGVGTTWNRVSWGAMIYQSGFAVWSGGPPWYLILPPSLALSLFAAAFYLISRGLQDVADPRFRRP